jgi:hypothetical protein
VTGLDTLHCTAVTGPRTLHYNINTSCQTNIGNQHSDSSQECYTWVLFGSTPCLDSMQLQPPVHKLERFVVSLAIAEVDKRPRLPDVYQ